MSRSLCRHPLSENFVEIGHSQRNVDKVFRQRMTTRLRMSLLGQALASATAEGERINVGQASRLSVVPRPKGSGTTLSHAPAEIGQRRSDASLTQTGETPILRPVRISDFGLLSAFGFPSCPHSTENSEQPHAFLRTKVRAPSIGENSRDGDCRQGLVCYTIGTHAKLAGRETRRA